MCEGCYCTCDNKPWQWIDCGYHQAVKGGHPAILREQQRRYRAFRAKIDRENEARTKPGWPLIGQAPTIQDERGSS